MAAHFTASPSSGIVHQAVISIFISVFISTVSIVTVTIILHHSCLFVVLVASISVIVDDGLILNDGIPTTAVVSSSTVITTLLISVIAAALEILFELFLVSIPMLLYRKKKTYQSWVPFETCAMVARA